MHVYNMQTTLFRRKQIFGFYKLEKNRKGFYHAFAYALSKTNGQLYHFVDYYARIQNFHIFYLTNQVKDAPTTLRIVQVRTCLLCKKYFMRRYSCIFFFSKKLRIQRIDSF